MTVFCSVCLGLRVTLTQSQRWNHLITPGLLPVIRLRFNSLLQWISLQHNTSKCNECVYHLNSGRLSPSSSTTQLFWGERHYLTICWTRRCRGTFSWPCVTKGCWILGRPLTDWSNWSLCICCFATKNTAVGSRGTWAFIFPRVAESDAREGPSGETHHDGAQTPGEMHQ